MIDTLPLMWRDLMSAESIESDRCVICGASWPLNQHHIVPRSAGNMFDGDGKKLVKPTVTLCGSGNTSGCHGKAHAGLLHFRNTKGWLEYLMPPFPCDRISALDMDGWQRVENVHERSR